MKKKIKPENVLDQFAQKCVKEVINNIRKNKPLYSIVWEMITDTIVGCSLGIGTNNMPSFHAAILSSTRTGENAKKVLMDFKKYIEKWVSIYEDHLRKAAESTKQIPQFIDGDKLQSLINIVMNTRSTTHSNISES